MQSDCKHDRDVTRLASTTNYVIPSEDGLPVLPVTYLAYAPTSVAVKSGHTRLDPQPPRALL